MRDDPHKVLGLPPGATDEEIRSAYRSLARKLHPDASGSAETAEAFGKLTEAYDALREKPRDEGEPVPVRRGPASPARVRAEPMAAGPRRSQPVAEPLGAPRRAEPLHRRVTDVRPPGPAARPRTSLSDLLPLLWLLDPDYFD